MNDEGAALDSWSAEQVADGKRWVETWKLAGPELERIRRQELRELDTYRTIAMLCGPADYTVPRALRNRGQVWSSNNAGS